jgi:hypothetical protein
MMRPTASSSFSIRQRVLLWSMLFAALQPGERIFLLRDAVAREPVALYETSHVVLDQNRIWSWKEFAHRL